MILWSMHYVTNLLKILKQLILNTFYHQKRVFLALWKKMFLSILAAFTEAFGVSPRRIFKAIVSKCKVWESSKKRWSSFCKLLYIITRLECFLFCEKGFFINSGNFQRIFPSSTTKNFKCNRPSKSRVWENAEKKQNSFCKLLHIVALFQR